MLGPSRACHCCDDRRGAAVESQGEGRAATADSGGGPDTGQEGPPRLGIVGGDLLGFRFAGCAFRRCSAPRGHVALEAATGPGGETGAEHALRLGSRNADQLGPIRRGAGPRPETRNTVTTVVAETLIPSCSSSPWMRI